MKIETHSTKETQKIAALLAREILVLRPKHAVVLALEGNLGAGKTTFTQGFAKALGIKENVLSPTFVLLKVYPIQKKGNFKHLIHIDCYRLDSPDDVRHLGFKKMLEDGDAIIVIEWASKIKKILPHDALRISFRHNTPTKRVITIHESR